jgi:hypothetical protein
MATTPAVYQDGEVTKMSPISSAPISLDVVALTGIGQVWHAELDPPVNINSGATVTMQWVPTVDGVINTTSFVAPEAGWYRCEVTLQMYVQAAWTSATQRCYCLRSGNPSPWGDSGMQAKNVDIASGYQGCGATYIGYLAKAQTVTFYASHVNNAGQSAAMPIANFAATRLS